MATLLAIIDRYDWIIYIVCTFGALVYLSWALAANRERSLSIFALEREEKGAEARRALLLFVLFVGIAGVTGYMNRWVLAEPNGGPVVGQTIISAPTPTPSPIIGGNAPLPTSTPAPSPTELIAVASIQDIQPTPTESPPVAAAPESALSPSPAPATTTPSFQASPTVAPPPPTLPPPTLPPPTLPPPTLPPPTEPPPPPTEAPRVAVAPAACPSPGARITSPGHGQQVSGVVNIMGTAAIENFQFYKVEYNAGNGFAVIGDVVPQPVNGGWLASWNAGAFPSGAYTLRLTVVDQTGNYPPPCDVTVIVP